LPTIDIAPHSLPVPAMDPLYGIPDVPARLAVVYMLARRLERLECGVDGADAEQYLFIVQCLTEALAAVRADRALYELLDDSPAARELYENLHYRRAGLCCSPQREAAQAARLAADAILRIRHRCDAPPPWQRAAGRRKAR